MQNNNAMIIFSTEKMKNFIVNRRNLTKMPQTLTDFIFKLKKRHCKIVPLVYFSEEKIFSKNNSEILSVSSSKTTDRLTRIFKL